MNLIDIPVSQRNSDEKFRVSLSVAEMNTICNALSAGDGALDNLALIQRFHKTMAKASVGAVMAAYAGATKQPGMATIAKIQQSEAHKEAESLLHSLRAGQIVLTEDQMYQAMNYLIDVLKEAPKHPKEIAALDAYMSIKIQKSIGG